MLLVRTNSNVSAVAMRLAIIISRLIGLTLGLAVRSGHDHDHHDHCPPFNNGTFNIHQWQLYPDTAAFDLDNCVLYIR